MCIRDRHQAVAKAWLQAGWTDFCGVIRTLTGLSQAEADQIARVLDHITQPILAEEVMQTLKQSGRLVYDGDLTARPVSNTSLIHISEPTRLGMISYAVFCLKK